MECVHPAPAQPVLQGEARIFPKMRVQEISRAIRRLAPDYCGNCVNDEPQVLFDNIRRSVRVAVARIGPCLAHGVLHQTDRASSQGICTSWWLHLPSRYLPEIPPLRCADSTP